ncbi:DNA cytosine methyltransferase [Streptomyces sp. IMTB 1903]|uniref:DNA cytosine methyltransferase n=1 Tax=Streptomyces sp. IMTB 1903 TaxID=1776680 RepID=UPI000756C64F|nr:DNA cytosine methyltransferase [Streptomyces sp. IMTB 1903]
MNPTDTRIPHAQNLELRKEHNIVGAFVNVPDVDGRTLAYCVTTAVRDFNGNMRTFFNIVTLDGRYISKGYKSPGAVTKWCRANRDEIAPVPTEDPSNQVEPIMVESEDDISDPNTPGGRQAWSVVKLSRDAQKYAAQAEEHAKEAERLALETACYADISEVSRTVRACEEQISEAQRHADLIRPEFDAAERLYRRSRWAHAAAYRISSVMFFSDGPWDAVMDDWTEKSSDAHASAMEYRDRAEGAIQDAGEDVRRAERQLDRACAVCGTWYPCTRLGRELTADLYDRGGYTCGCGGAVEVDDVAEPVEPCDGQMSFDDAPEPEPAAEQYTAEMAEHGPKKATKQGENTVGRGSKAPRKVSAAKVGDILFATDSFPTTAQLLGHFYTVNLLAGSYTVTHNGTREALIFTGADKKSVCRTGGTYFPTRPSMKQAILRDAGARGAVEEHQEQPQERREPLTYADLEGKTLSDFTAPEDRAELETLAGPWPVRWLFAPKKGDPRRVLHLFAGCGGWCVGIRRVLGERVDMVCVDMNRDAVATSIGAGCTAIQADVTTLYPEAYALRYTSGLVMSPPCIDWTMSGKRAGLTAENIGILLEAISEAAYVAGNYELDSTEYGGQCEEHDEDEGEACTGAGCCADSCCWSEHMGRSIGSPETWTSVRETAARMSGKTARLMVEPVIWALGLKGAGVPLETIVMEQSDQLPEEIREEIESEFMVAGSWGTVGMAQQCDWVELDAADFGSPSHRRRAFLVAGWGRAAYTAGLPQAPEGLSTTAAEAVPNRPAELEILTRGNRRTSGGNAIRLSDTIPCVTSKIRSWDVEYHGGRFTLQEVAALVTLPPEYAEYAEGSRSSVCQQFADIVAPVISAAVFGAACGRSWLPELLAYLGELYPLAHGDADTAEIPAEDSPAGGAQDSAPADTEEKEEPGYGLRDGERVRYVGGYDSEYAVMLAGDPERWVCGRGADGERLEGSYTFVGPWSHGGKGYSVRFNGKRFVSVDCPSEILPAVRKHAAKQAAPVKAQPTPGLYAPTLHTEERAGDVADECREGGHRYVWLVVEAEGVSRTLRSYLTCACTGEKLGNFGRSGPSMNQGTQTKPLGIRDASIASALGVAKRNSYTTKGPWEIVSDTLKRCPVEWDHAKPLPVADDPARDPQPGEPGFMVALLEKRVGPDWKPIEATADPEFKDVEEEAQAPVQGLAQISQKQRRAAWRLAAGEKKPEVPAGESAQEIPRADTEKKSLALEAAPVRPMLEAAPVVLPDTGRAYWEPGQRVTLDGRAGRTRYSTFDGVRVEWDDAPSVCDYVSPRVLWVEGAEPVAERADEPDELLVALLTEELREQPVDPRIGWAAYERPAPVDPRLAWMDYERPEPEPVDVLAELRAELEELRRDVDTWGAEVAALAVAEAERIVAEVARDMRAAELLELREEARAVREDLGWGPVVWEPIPGKPWRRAWTVAAGWTAGLIAAGAEGWREGTELALRQ